MRPIFFCADVHVGNHQQHGGPLVSSINTRCRFVLDALEAAVELVLDCDGILVIAGDLFDVVRPEAPIIAEVQRILEPATSIIVKGNHDSNSNEPGDHALAPLEVIATVVEEPEVIALDDVNLWCVPARPDLVIDWLPDTLAKLHATADHSVPHNVLAIHAGISEAKTAVFLKKQPDQIEASKLADLCHKHGVGHVFAGNWHDRKTWEFFYTENEQPVRIVQVGALAPTGYDNPGLIGYGGVAEFKDGRTHVHEIDGPRFVKVRGGLDDAHKVIEQAKRPEALHLQVLTEPEHVESITDALGALVTAGKIAASKVLAEKAYREAAAATAAHSARSAESIDGAIEGYCRRMPLRDGCTSWLVKHDRPEPEFREGVTQAVRDCLVEAMTT